MRAIILPLNKYFYNYESYDGSSFDERFKRKYPKIDRIDQSRFFDKFGIYLIVIPTIILILIFFCFPAFLFLFIKYGYKGVLPALKKSIDAFLAKGDRILFKKRRRNIS